MAEMVDAEEKVSLPQTAIGYFRSRALRASAR